MREVASNELRVNKILEELNVDEALRFFWNSDEVQEIINKEYDLMLTIKRRDPKTEEQEILSNQLYNKELWGEHLFKAFTQASTSYLYAAATIFTDIQLREEIETFRDRILMRDRSWKRVVTNVIRTQLEIILSKLNS